MTHLPILLKLILVLLYSLSPTLKPLLAPVGSYEASYENLGIPLSEYYRDGIRARTAWDVEIYNEKLFVASGDYDANSGPVHIYEYDLNEGLWRDSATVLDEQIERFIILDDGLLAPGCDPRQDWTYGNIYRYEDDTWNTYRTIPGGIHQFDAVKFDGKLFVGLGVAPGEYPVAMSEDGGQSFQSVSMYKDGIPLDTSVAENISVQIRIYDFFILNDQLYAFYFRYFENNLTLELYRYDNGAFYYHSDLPGKFSYKRINYEVFNAKAEYQGTMYFTTGNLYTSKDMKSANRISFGSNANVPDLRVIGDQLYACVVSPTEDGQYRSSIWVKSQSNNQFKEVFYFIFPCPAQSFTYHDGVFYFGMGDGILSDHNPNNGTILKVTHAVK